MMIKRRKIETILYIFLQYYLPSGFSEILLELLRDSCVNILFALDPGNPAMVKRGLARESVLHIDAHQAPDEVLGFLGDVVPVGGIKLKLA